MSNFDVNINIRSRYDRRGVESARRDLARGRQDRGASRAYYTGNAGQRATSYYGGQNQNGAGARTRGRAPFLPLGLTPRFLGVAGLGLGLKNAAGEAISFGAAMADIQAKAGATDDEMQKIRKNIMELAQDNTLSASMDDIVGGFNRAAAAGIPIEKMGEFVRLVAKGAPPLAMSGQALGDMLAKLDGANLVGLDKSADFLDLVNALEDAGTSDAADILDFMVRAGAQAKIFGFAAEETAALGTAMIDLGMKSGEASTAVNSMLTKLSAPDALPKAGKQAFRKLFKNTDEWKKLVEKDAVGALDTLLERLGSLDKSDRSSVAANLFGLEHADVVQRLVEGLDKVRERQKLAAGDSWLGNLEKTAGLKLETTQAKLDILKRKLQGITIDAASAGLPVFNDAIDGTIKFIDNLRAAIDEVDFDSQPFADAAAAIGELVDAMGMDDFELVDAVRLLKNLAEVAANSVKAIADELRSISEFLDDPMGYLADTENQEKAQETFKARQEQAQKFDDAASEFLEGWGLNPQQWVGEVPWASDPNYLPPKDRREKAAQAALPTADPVGARLTDLREQAEVLKADIAELQSLIDQTPEGPLKASLTRPRQQILDEQQANLKNVLAEIARHSVPSSEQLPRTTSNTPKSVPDAAAPQFDMGRMRQTFDVFETLKAKADEPIAAKATLDTSGFDAALSGMIANSESAAAKIRQNLSISAGSGGNYLSSSNDQFAPATN